MKFHPYERESVCVYEREEEGCSAAACDCWFRVNVIFTVIGLYRFYLTLQLARR